MQNGLYIDSISLETIKVKQLYIKWNKKLNISVKECTISLPQDNSPSTVSSKDIYKIIDKVPYFYNFFESININKIKINDLTASFNYHEGEDGFIVVDSNSLLLRSTIYFENKLLNLSIDNFKDLKRDIKISGNIILSTKKENAIASLKIDIHDEILLNTFVHMNNEKLIYKINSMKNIKSIDYVMSLIPIHKEINYWANKAISFSSLKIDKAYGWVNFNDIANAHKNIYVSAVGEDLTYRYNPKLDNIRTKRTELEFKEGILYIYPKKAHTYKSYLGDKNSIIIDFTQKEELLTLQLLFEGMLDKDTLGILKAYKIKVPFLQKTGITKTNLVIKVNLRTIDVDAQGDFFTKKAKFEFKGLDIDIFNSSIKLNNYDVTINKMFAKYQDIMSADVAVEFNAKNTHGFIDLHVKKIDFKDLNISLNKNIFVRYSISQKGDNIAIPISSWNIHGYDIDVAKMKLPFNINTTIITIPKTNIAHKNNVKGTVSGKANVGKLSFDLDMDISQFLLYGVETTQKNIPLKLNFHNKLTLSSEKKINFEFLSQKSFIDTFIFNVKDSKIVMEKTFINIGDIIKTDFKSHFSFINNQGLIITSDSSIKTPSVGVIYKKKAPNSFKITSRDNNIEIDSMDLSLQFKSYNDQWKVDINSIAKLTENSQLLDKYFIKNGTATVFKKDNVNKINFTANIKYPYRFLIDDNKEIEDYKIKGDIDTGTSTTSLSINKLINLTIQDSGRTKVFAKKIGININAIFDMVSAIKTDSNSSKNNLDITLNTTDSFIYLSEKRHAISDSLHVLYKNDILSGKLLYEEGVAQLKLADNKFSLQGRHFNDMFINNLFSLSKFKGGTLNFDLGGTPQKYNGIFTIDDSTLVDYVIFNNILAFVNTVPALLTFSLPDYNKNGFKIKEAYTEFTFENNLYTINDIYFDSKELDVLGKGEVSIKNNTIDLDINLKTDIGSFVSKIPVIGYLLFDGDVMSTSLKVDGKLNDPTVTSRVAQDIVIAPLNFLKRTLMLPYHLSIEKD